MNIIEMKVEPSPTDEICTHLEHCKEVAKGSSCAVITTFNSARFRIVKDSNISKALDYYHSVLSGWGFDK